MSDLVAAIPRGDYPAYAAAHVRELVARYRPSVLWNDIAWPSEGKHLWPLLTEYYAAVPDGVVNDRWMPWNPLAGAMRFGPARKALDAGTTRQARKDAGLIPPEPPFYDVRTPEYVSFPTIQRRPWECVRGMDHSFGYNAASRPDDFLTRPDLLWSFVDMVSKNGNLLLNVGPRGVDAQIPDEQRLRLAWLGEWMVANGDAVRATRPWVRPEGTTAEGIGVRYAARDREVFAVLERGSDRATLTDVVATPTTAVTAVDGAPLEWHVSDGGVRVHLGPDAAAAGTPVAVRCSDVAPTPVT